MNEKVRCSRSVLETDFFILLLIWSRIREGTAARKEESYELIKNPYEHNQRNR